MSAAGFENERTGEIRGRDLAGDLEGLLESIENEDDRDAALEDGIGVLVYERFLSETDGELLLRIGRERLARLERENPATAFYVLGVDAAGFDSRYPADGFLEDTTEPAGAIITDEDEAVETARCALLESEGWKRASIYRRSSDGMHVRVRVLER